MSRRELLTGLAGVILALAVSWPGQRTLTLWPRAADWPSLASIERGLRLPDLWAAVYDGALFNLFVRLADAFDIHPPAMLDPDGVPAAVTRD